MKKRLLLVRFALFLCFICSAEANAGVGVCKDPADYSFASIDFANHHRSPIDQRAGETNQENQNLDLLVASKSMNLSFGFGHRYMIFDFSDIEPRTNAHLHTSFLPLHWQSRGDDHEVRLSAALALSASSNVMGHPREYNGDALQFLVALLYETRLSERLSVRYGICGDHRFGEYRVYPVAGMAWRPHRDWELELGFPSSSVSVDLTERITSSLRIGPDGNEWYVMDRDFAAHSRFVYESIRLEWITSWQLHPRLGVSLSLGRQLRNRYDMTLQTGERVHLSSEPATLIGAGIRWSF